MKKYVILFCLCMTLLFTAACGGDKQPPATPTPVPTSEPTPSPSPTPVPENEAVNALERLEEKLQAMLSRTGTADLDMTKGIGYDVTIDVSVNQMLLSLLGMTDLNQIGIDLSADMNQELLGMNMALSLGNETLLASEMLYDYEKLLMNVPKYSSAYMLSETTEGSASDNAAVSVDYAKLTELARKFISDSFLNFRPVDSYTDNATLEADAYKVTGRKFSATLSMSEFSTLLQEYEEIYQSLFPGTDLNLSELEITDFENLVLDYYYTGKEGIYGWSCYPDSAPADTIGVISAENGLCFFNTDEEILFYTEKTSDTEGTFYFPSEESPLTLVYTKGENQIDLYEPESDITISANWDFSENKISYGFTFAMTDMSVTCSMVIEGKLAHMEMALISYDTQLATLTADYTIREMRPVSMPETWLEPEAWRAQFDADAFYADIETMAEGMPEAVSGFLYGFYEGFTGIDVTPEDPSSEDPQVTPSVTPELPSGYDFSVLTGYAEDEYGNVEFLASEEEVLALGLTSTGIYGTVLTDEQRQTLVQYGSTVLDNPYSEYGTFYEISGNVYSSVDSYFYTEYYTADSANYYNQVDLYIEVLTGDFYSVGVANTSKEKAFAMANDILAILGETSRLDVNTDISALSNGIWVGDYYIYGWDNVDYFLIRIY